MYLSNCYGVNQVAPIRAIDVGKLSWAQTGLSGFNRL